MIHPVSKILETPCAENPSFTDHTLSHVMSTNSEKTFWDTKGYLLEHCLWSSIFNQQCQLLKHFRDNS